MKILFMCVANSARSQMAEGLAKSIFGPNAEIESAGSEPRNLNPLAVVAMKEIGIDISNHFSKSFDQISPRFTAGLDYVITLCAEEVCPTLASARARKLHWGFPDPARPDLPQDEQLKLFRQVRDGLRLRLEEFRTELKMN